VSFASLSPDSRHGSPTRIRGEFIKLAVEARTDFYTEVQQFLEARLSEIKKRTESPKARSTIFAGATGCSRSAEARRKTSRSSACPA